MTRGASISVENNFSKGLITEFTAMNFPENAVTSCDNVIFHELGRVTRRNGMDYEDDYVLNSVDASFVPNEDAVVEYRWVSTSDNGSIQFNVQQVGIRIYFFTLGGSLSANRHPVSISLLSHKVTSVSNDDVRTQPCQFTSGRGYLFVAHPNCEPFYVIYDPDADTFTATDIDVEIRDIAGLDDGLETDERPTTLSNIHKYNLYNQGWYTSAPSGGSEANQNVLTHWGNVRSDYPSDADIWWIFKGIDKDSGRETFDANNYGFDTKALGNTPAPRGHYIYDAFDINRTAKTGFSGLTTKSSGSARPSSIAWYAGRVWYAGVSRPDYATTVYFSQIVDGDDKIGKCYQRNDPTSESSFDLLDNDGGTIDLPLIGKVVSMKVVSDALIFIGTEGTYIISGGSDTGPFKATDYTVKYISTIGGVTHTSIQVVDSAVLWMNYDAIYAMKESQLSTFSVENISKNTIQSLLDDIPAANKPFIKSVYNKRDQKVQWLYSDDPDLTGYQYNRILEFNLLSQAFYTYTVDTDLGPIIVGGITTPGEIVSTEVENVVDNSSVIVTTAAGNVTVTVTQSLPSSEVFKYSTIVVNKLTYSDLKDINYRDWVTYNSIGVETSSYFTSGYRVRGEMLRSFNSSPVSIVLDNIETGEVIFKMIYDYGARSSMPQWLYGQVRAVDAVRHFNRGLFLIRRVKPRGKGKAAQLHFESDGDAPFSIVGWSTFDTGGQQP